LRECIDQLAWRFSAAALFPQVPTVRFGYSGSQCERCGKKLRVLKTHTKKAATLEIGSLKIHETIKHCDDCHKVYRSDEPRKLVAHGSRFGYNVLVDVGKLMFVDCKNEKQIQAELKGRNTPISIRQIGYLCKKFIVYLAIAHRESRSKIKDLLNQRGGYILHLDATCEGGSPHLMSALDEIAQIVLDNVKIPSEKAEEIIPFLQRIRDRYGMPIALVHDMGAGILSAVKAVFPGAPDYICHYHFLQDIGNDLFGFEYGRLRSELRKYGIRSSLRKIVKALRKEIEENRELAQDLDCYLKEEGKVVNALPAAQAYILCNWVLDSNSELDGYGFPFDRAHLVFYKRLKTAKSILDSLSAKSRQDRAIVKVNRALGRVVRDTDLETVVNRLEEKAAVFDNLRDAMRIGVSGGKKGLNDDGEGADIETIERSVTAFRNSDKVRTAAEKDSDYAKTVKQIDKYWDKLFADPITVTTANGEQILILPQRTNNILERFFRDLKRMYRSKSGTQSLNRVIKAMLADTPLVKNLSNPEYLEIILNGHKALEERFAEIDEELVREQMKKAKGEEHMSTKMKKVLRKPDFVSLFGKRPIIPAIS
jgi:hypothetical protein